MNQDWVPKPDYVVMQTFKPTGKTVREICYGSQHEGCVCFADQLPRDLPTYIEDAPDPKQILVLCDPCRRRLENGSDINIAPSHVLPFEPPDFPISAND